jgi:hypothetical protein
MLTRFRRNLGYANVVATSVSRMGTALTVACLLLVFTGCGSTRTPPTSKPAVAPVGNAPADSPRPPNSKMIGDLVSFKAYGTLPSEDTTRRATCDEPVRVPGRGANYDYACQQYIFTLDAESGSYEIRTDEPGRPVPTGGNISELSDPPFEAP